MKKSIDVFYALSIVIGSLLLSLLVLIFFGELLELSCNVNIVGRVLFDLGAK